MRIFRLAVLCAWALVATVMLLGPAAAHAFPASPTPQTTSTSTPKKKKAKKKHSKRQPTQQAPTPDRISEIQSALASGGYYQGDPNGKWDANTIAAMEKFQSSHGIEASGKLDAPTLAEAGSRLGHRRSIGAQGGHAADVLFCVIVITCSISRSCTGLLYAAVRLPTVTPSQIACNVLRQC